MGRYKEFKEIQSRYICFLRVLRRLNWVIYKDLGKMLCRWIVISYATELYENETQLIGMKKALPIIPWFICEVALFDLKYDKRKQVIYLTNLVDTNNVVLFNRICTDIDMFEVKDLMYAFKYACSVNAFDFLRCYVTNFAEAVEEDEFVIACSFGHIEIVKLFLEITNIDPVYENESIEVAIEKRHYDILELLLKCDGVNYKRAKRFASKYGDQKTRDIIKNIKK